jgi:DNA-binding transcriptional LysR family regulator
MDLRLLRTFITIAEQGTVSNAATRLRITQPALSRRMQDLQRELGLRLFDHVGRRLVLTSAGEQMLSECRSLLGHADALGERAQLLRDGDTGILKVATSPLQIEAVISTFLHRYIERFPKVQLKLIEAVGPDILAMLERGEINVGVVPLGVPDGDQRFSSHPVPHVEILAACHPSFPLRRGSHLSISELAPHPLLLLDPGYLVRKTFDAACRLAKLTPNILTESRAPSNLLALAEAGHGVAVIPSLVLTHRYEVRVARVVHDGKPLREPISIVWDKRRIMPRYIRDFSQMLAAHMREVLPIKLEDAGRRSLGAKRSRLASRRPAPAR